MHRRILRRFLIVLAATVAAIVVAIAFRPKPTEVESARVARGPLQVTIDEDGETRPHDRFTLAAPIAGRLSRIHFHEGDEVGSDTVLATISPLPLDAREIGEVRARIDAAEARRREADEQLARSESELAQAVRDFDRTRFLPEITSFPTNSWGRLKAGERLPQRMSKPRVFVFNPPLRMSNVRRLGLFHCKCKSTILAVSYLYVHRRDAGSCGFWKRANVSSPSALRSSS